jgi:hypothetical protein
MANHTITITGIDPTDPPTLILSDRGKTLVNPGDTVTWDIRPHSGVASITVAETPDIPGNIDVFDPDPAPLGNSGKWRGRVRPNIVWGAVEWYTINFTPEGGGTDIRFDPKIQVNSKP